MTKTKYEAASSEAPTCEYCDGTGLLISVRKFLSRGNMNYVNDDYVPCHQCEGTGHVLPNKNLKENNYESKID